MLYNAAIHKTKDVKYIIKQLKLAAFTIPPYNKKINKVEYRFWDTKDEAIRKKFSKYS